MINAIEEKLLAYGYAGNVSDLVYYAGSENGLDWYFENYLEKILLNSHGFYAGAFIRYKVKSEARRKYTEHLSKVHEQKIKEAKELLRKIEDQIKNQKSELSLTEWFRKYNQETDFESREADICLFIEQSGHFDIYSSKEKHQKLQEFLEEEMFPSLYAGLFRTFLIEFKKPQQNNEESI